MKKKFYIKPESVVVPYVDHLMDYEDLKTSTYDAFAKENNTFFNNDDDYDGELWSDFVPFEEDE